MILTGVPAPAAPMSIMQRINPAMRHTRECLWFISFSSLELGIQMLTREVKRLPGEIPVPMGRPEPGDMAEDPK
jgi:hypothetical protein